MITLHVLSFVLVIAGNGTIDFVDLLQLLRNRSEDVIGLVQLRGQLRFSCADDVFFIRYVLVQLCFNRGIFLKSQLDGSIAGTAAQIVQYRGKVSAKRRKRAAGLEKINDILVVAVQDAVQGIGIQRQSSIIVRRNAKLSK